MQLQKIFFASHFLLIWKIILFEYVSSAPLVGHNIREVMENEFPFIAGLTKRVNKVVTERDIICTGVIFTKNHILTAAHCVRGSSFKDIQIIVGSTDITCQLKYYVAWWISFDQWNELKNINNGFVKNDIIIIRLTDGIPDSIPLATMSYVSRRNVFGAEVFTVGWGELNNGSYPNTLQTVNLKVLSTNACENKISTINGERLYIDENILCTYKENFAILMRGDSGGPLIYNNAVIGINMGTCPFPQQWFHQDKVNLHTSISYYQEFFVDVVANF